MLDFSVNLNPLGPPDIIKHHWDSMINQISSYPSMEGNGIKKFMNAHFGIPLESILPGNGAIELIYLVPRALKLKRVGIFTPSFYDYARASQVAGAEIIAFSNLSENEFDKKLSSVDSVFLGNPNNPTGQLIDLELILFLAKKHPEKYFLIDESFIQFVDSYREKTLLNKKYIRSNVLVFHSLTKFYALPGLRLGSVVGHPDVISKLKIGKMPWSVNGIADHVAPLLLKATSYENQTKDLIQYERTKIYSFLSKNKKIKLIKTEANFFLAQWMSSDNLDDLLRHLLTNGIYVRDCRNFKGLMNNYFRFCIRQPKENDGLLKAITMQEELVNG